MVDSRIGRGTRIEPNLPRQSLPPGPDNPLPRAQSRGEDLRRARTPGHHGLATHLPVHYQSRETDPLAGSSESRPPAQRL